MHHMLFITGQIHIVKLMGNLIPDGMHSEKEILSHFCDMEIVNWAKIFKSYNKLAPWKWEGLSTFVSSDMTIWYNPLI